jgi:uncharacterized protein YjbI with pentapeptide repeats
MTSYGRSASDVRRWPDDDAARQALTAYFAAFPSDPQAVIPVLDGSGLDFTGADLSGLELLGAEFSDANLAGVRMAEADLDGAWLLSAILRGADLSHTSLRKAQARSFDAEGVIAVEADLRRADLENANLRRADLRGVFLGRARLPGADLRDADLRGCVFGQDGTRAALKEARMAGCLLEGARGPVSGPIDVGAGEPHLLDGAELGRWFADNGADQVEVSDPVNH